MGKRKLERACALCEYGREIQEGEYCICEKKGVVDPTSHCSKFRFDPLKIKVSVKKLPEFCPWDGKKTDTKKEEAE
ncbi:MAG: hypothetical protein IKC69_00205 [Clostridia bacterium]|nr:hypothetical protein [Clostridia bacterium]